MSERNELDLSNLRQLVRKGGVTGVRAWQAGERFRRSMGKLLAQAAESPEAVQSIRDGVLRLAGTPPRSAEYEALETAFLAAVEAHKSHRSRLRHDPGGIWRCPECDPVSPAAVARPTVCPCGHPVGDEYLCIEGRIYGPCGDENCGGVCEYDGECKGQCACGEDE